jgi:sugar lactone lactonase YvrE
VTYVTVYTAATTVFNFGGTAGTSGSFYGLDEKSVTFFSNSLTSTATFTPTFSPTVSPTPGSGGVTVSGTVSTTFGTVDSIQALWLILEPVGGGQQSVTSVFVNNGAFTIVTTAGSYNLLGFYDEISGYNGGTVPTGDGPGYYQGAGNGFACSPPGTPPITASVSGLAVTLNPLACGTSPTPVITPIPTGTFTFTNTPTPTVTGTPTSTLSPTTTPTATLVAASAIFNPADEVGPNNIAVNSAGTSVYLSDNFPPGGGTLTEDGDIYIWTGSGSSYSATSTTTIIDTVTGGLAFPVGMAVDSSGNVYITDSGNANEVIEYNSTLTSQLKGIGVNDPGSSAAPGKLFEPVGVALDSAGNVYVSDNDPTYTVQSFQPPSFTSGLFGATSPSTYPFIAVNSAGTTIFTAPYGSIGVVNLLDGSGNPLGTWTGNFDVNGLAVAPPGGPNAGNLYISDNKNHQVVEFNTSGTIVGTWGSLGTGSGQFTEPVGIAVDGSGNIYVVDNNLGNSRVEKFAAR